MKIRNPEVPFAVYHEVLRQLDQKAPRILACGKNAAKCCTGALEPHYCCSAHKILNPSTEAPLSKQQFHDTLKHYKIPASREQAEEAHLDYLEDACISDVSDDIAAASREASDLGEAEYDAEDAGDRELARSLALKADEKTREMRAIVSKAADRAKEMAAAL